jgi:hypothetical protein
VAIAAIAVALLPAGAHAATPGTTPTVASAAFANTVTIDWTPSAADPPLTQEVWRGAGACGTPPIGGAASVPVAGNSATATTASDANVPDGVYCYYVQADNLAVPPAPTTAYSAGRTVTVDVVAPTATIVVAPTGAPNFVRGATVGLTGTSADAGSGVASSIFHFGTVGNCPAGLTTPTVWNTTGLADGLWDVCYVVTDNAAHTTIATAPTVIVDNTAPLGGVLTPSAGLAVSGNAVVLTTDAVDAPAGIRQVQWQRSATGNAPWPNIGAIVTNPAGGYVRNWNTAAVGVGDGPDYLRAVVLDNAGNQLITPTIAVTVDNTPPDVAPLITAPPAVAGSPTLSWTPAHDAVGVARYDVLRGTTVIGTVAHLLGALTYSFNDKGAPDQTSSSYVVRAYDATGHSIDSASVSVLVDSKAQSAPRTVAAATPTAAPPVLTWQAPAVFTVDHYDVYRDGLLLASTVGPGTTYTDSVAAEGVHDYAVLARSPTAQPGVLSSSFKVVLDRTPPTSGGSPTAQVLAAGGVQLGWPAASDSLSGVAGYVVRRASGATPPAAADGGTAVCAPTGTSCADAATASGTWSYGVFARDVAGNVALIGTVAGVTINDTTAPLAPTRLKLSLLKTKTRKPSTILTYTLRWVEPTEPDLERVVVVLNLKRPPAQPADGKAIYKGLASSTKLKLRAGQTAYLALFAFDTSGNVSPKPARTVVKLASLIPLRPLSGSLVRSSSPMLSWKAEQGTAYYNLQLFVNGKRVLVGWPSAASYRVPPGKLQPGTYVWYVWPAIKHKGGAPTFGKLIGRATFTYKQ